MGRKGSWITAIKKVFIPKEKQANELSEKRSTQVKTSLGKQRLREGGGSFIPLFRQPSSIEKILGEAEREHHHTLFLNRPPSLAPEQSRKQAYVPPRTTSSRPGSLRIGSSRATSPRDTSPRGAAPKAPSSRIVSTSISLPKTSSSKVVTHNNKPTNSYRAQPTVADRCISATKIQAVYRGYVARRSLRALKGLVRLQGVVRGQSVQRQTMNAMKQMQLMVRVQTQIQSRRIQLLENHRHHQYKNANDTFTKWRMSSESGNADWEDSVLTKEEIEARMQKKIDAAVKRERAMAYAYSHKLMKGTPKSSQETLIDHRTGSFPWWWNWLERRLPSTQPHETQSPALNRTNHPTSQRSVLPNRMSPLPQTRNYKQHTFESDAYESVTPRSTKSSFIPRWKPTHTPTRTVSQTPTPGRVSQLNTPNRTSSGRHTTKYSKPKPTGAESPIVKDDDSLNSCPTFSAPSYMAATASAKAKVRAGSTPTEAADDATPGRRFSFPLSQGIGTFKWNKGSS